MPLGVVDQPVALAGQVTIQRVQRGPQLSRRRNGLSCTSLTRLWCNLSNCFAEWVPVLSVES
jgi:hypothetical protein